MRGSRGRRLSRVPVDMTHLLVALVVVWVAAKAGGEAATRIGQPAVLGELLAGVLVGPGVLGLVHETEVLHALAEIGVILLLFEVGLESNLDELLKAGAQSVAVAVAGVVTPFVAGFVTMRAFGYPTLVAVFAVALAAVADLLGLATRRSSARSPRASRSRGRSAASASRSACARWRISSSPSSS